VAEDTRRSLARQLEELNRIGAALAAERDTGRLLTLILTKAREITGSDAGSLYVVEAVEPVEAPPGERRAEAGDQEPERRLRFTVAQNDSVAWPFSEGVLDITERSIAGYVALTGETVNLGDAYRPPKGVPYTFNRRFDEMTGYRTQSVLAVPMRTPKGHIVGVLQLINAKRRRAAHLDSEEAVAAGAVRYSQRQAALAVSLAAQAAVALENSQLYSAIQQLFEGFVRASIVAIEARDPATSGHSFRVANLTVALAEAVDRADLGPFAGVRFSRDDLRTIRYASLLHDFGKVAVNEEVLVKAKKLYPAQLELVRERFRMARRTRELASADARLAYLLAHGRDQYVEELPAFERALGEEVARLDRQFRDVQAANEPTVVPDGRFDAIRDIAAESYLDVDGIARPLLEEPEVRLLSLRRGTLSDLERLQIELHVVHSYHFLSRIPWTREIRRIPSIALGHHEKLNGTGYPGRLSAPEIPIQTRMMTISDIFDALSAADRPYKRAIPTEAALDILGSAVADGELDADLFALFVEARIFDRWLTEPHPY